MCRGEGTDDEPRARRGVHAAKVANVALGERGRPWWGQAEDERRERGEAKVSEP